MKKRVLSLLLSAVMVTSLFAGCGAKEEPAETPDAEVTEDEKAEEKEVETVTDIQVSGVTACPNAAIKTRRTKRDINLRLRFLVMKRDNFKCCMCGRSPATTPNLELHIDHIKPWSKGGETVIENLQTLCADCNLGKSNLE